MSTNVVLGTGGDTTITNNLTVSGTGNNSIAGTFQFNSGYGSVATAYGCRAWVNFNGTGTVAIRASGNVSSITDNGVGDYTVNFTTALVDANYAFTVGYRGVANNDTDYTPVLHTGSSPSTTAARFVVNNMSLGSSADIDYVCISIFR
jgi:hypothetical protein